MCAGTGFSLSDVRTSDWAAIVPWAGIQNVPTPVSGLLAANPPQTSFSIPLAPLTAGSGQTGSIQVVNGVIISVKDPT